MPAAETTLMSANSGTGPGRSGKDAGDENFPVGSFLLPRHLRPHVAAYYRFARAADDIADDPDMRPEDKVAALDSLEAALLGAAPELPETAPLRRTLAETGLRPAHATDLLIAFREDSRGLACRDWAHLMAYCRHSAAPVGRFLVDLHSPDPAAGDRLAWAPSDALCAALQVLNHLQDVKSDRERLDRVYLPADWLADEGLTAEDLGAEAAAPGLRRVLDRCLVETWRLLDAAAPLSRLIDHPGFRVEATMIHALARRLARRLTLVDPLARRVDLKRTDWLGGALEGLLYGL
ncbi:squalene synthase HpnC [Roseospirillum parvum]|uniref:Squalene synthase HpnC n=1 Tax=Roseospirillum parvum TaxID=83401 RepID=A0A1G7V0J9_9PROT|nr:squalene synthase HpnC [Roseospirillum parvum]SDG53395.1 squalene synthase HpnC [Roseospirillum parvum]